MNDATCCNVIVFYETAEEPNRRTAEEPNRRPAEPPNRRTARDEGVFWRASKNAKTSRVARF